MSASLAPECNKVKDRYDTCFLKWYSEKYLKGTATSDDCKHLFDDYEKCLKVIPPQNTDMDGTLIERQKALKERGIDKMIENAREDNRDTNTEQMSVKSR